MDRFAHCKCYPNLAVLNLQSLCPPLDGALTQVFVYLLSLAFYLEMMQQLPPEKHW